MTGARGTRLLVLLMACVLSACGGSSAGARQAKGQFTCPSPPMPAAGVAVCEAEHKNANELTLSVPPTGGSVSGSGVIDGSEGAGGPPDQAPPGTPPAGTGCVPGWHWVIAVSGQYDKQAGTITGTLTGDGTPMAGTCLTTVFRPQHFDRPFTATVSGGKVVGEVGVLFFEATLE